MNPQKQEKRRLPASLDPGDPQKRFHDDKQDKDRQEDEQNFFRSRNRF
jgi:hypothetical protein